MTSSRILPHARHRAVLAAVFLVVAGLLAVLVPVHPAGAASSSELVAADEDQFLALVNEERAEHGIRPLTMSDGVRLVARDWSLTMAADDSLYHRPSLSEPFTGSWTRLGENVGRGHSVEGLHDAFMNSSGHRANVLDDSFTWVGVGSVRVESGAIWVTFNFGAGDDQVDSRFLQDYDRLQADAPFTDVAAWHPFVGEIGWLQDEAITRGCGDDAFCPTAPVTRQAMAAFLNRALDLPDAGESDFSDVPDDHPFAADIAALAAAGITTGCDGGEAFCPTAPVTRQAMAAFLTRALDLQDTDDSLFDDVGVDHPFASEIGALSTAGITTGCDGGEAFCPTAPVTRQAMAAFLHRALG